jgi:hypothetical protein
VIARLAAPAAGLALVLSGVAGDSVVAALVVIATLLLAVLLPGVAGRREGPGLPSVVALAGIAAVALALLEVQRSGGSPDTPDAVLPVLAAIVPVAAAAQLLRRDGRADLVGSLGLTVAVAMVAATGALWVTLGWTPFGNAATVVAGVGLMVAGLVVLVQPWWRARGRTDDAFQVVVLAAGAVGGLAALLLLDPGTLAPVQAVALGLWSGGTLVLARQLVEQAWGPAPQSVRSGAERAEDSVRDPEPGAEVGAGTGSNAGPALDAEVPNRTSSGVRALSALRVRTRATTSDEAEVVVAALAVLLAGGPLYVLTRILIG